MRSIKSNFNKISFLFLFLCFLFSFSFASSAIGIPKNEVMNLNGTFYHVNYAVSSSGNVWCNGSSMASAEGSVDCGGAYGYTCYAASNNLVGCVKPCQSSTCDCASIAGTDLVSLGINFTDSGVYTCGIGNPKRYVGSYVSSPECGFFYYWKEVEDCGNPFTGYWSENYCKNGDVYKQRTNISKGCSNGACFSNRQIEETRVQDCEDKGCSNGLCNSSPSCTSHAYSSCSGNDLYWFDSCNQMEEIKQDCGESEQGEWWESFCSNGNVYERLTNISRGCSNNACYSNDDSETNFIQDCEGNGCTDGACDYSPSCYSHEYYQCYNKDVYWYNSCNQRESKKNECGSSSTGSWGANYCKSGNVYKQRTNLSKGCSSDNCYSNSQVEESLVQNCQGKGCSNGTCNSTPTCTSHFYSACYNGNAYWYNSCNQKEDLKQDCKGGGCNNGSCTYVPGDVHVTNYTSSIDVGYVGSIEWNIEGGVNETGIYFAYKSDKSDAIKITGKLNSSSNYAAMVSSKKGVCAIYVAPYVKTTTGWTITANWVRINVGNTCSNAMAKAYKIQEMQITKTGLALNSEDKADLAYADSCDSTIIPFEFTDIDWAAFTIEAGIEGAKLITIGSCIDDGILTLGCGFDVVSTVIMIEPVGGTELGAAAKAAKVLAFLSDGAKAFKIVNSLSKLSKIGTGMNLFFKGVAKPVSGTIIARGTELGIMKVDFLGKGITTTTENLAEWFATKGETAIIKLKNAGATNEMLEIVITKGSTILNKTIHVFNWQKGTAYLGDGIAKADGWGWGHILFQKHHNEIQKALKLANNDLAVKEVIYEAVKTGTIVKNLDGKYEILAKISRNGLTKDIRVIVSSDTTRKTEGRIITAFHPTS